MGEGWVGVNTWRQESASPPKGGAYSKEVLMRMQTMTWPIVFLLAGAAVTAEGATFTSGSTGADGAFSPTANTTLTVPASGVFNFTTVTIPASITVTFKKNAANTPVVILAMGDVTIGGWIKVSGSDAVNLTPGEGGPGGFAGGAASFPGMDAGSGLGPGGGGGGKFVSGGYNAGGGGGFRTPGIAGTGTAGGAAGAVYGGDRLVPLIGGSGGGGSTAKDLLNYGSAGGGGGGTLLIASSGKITIAGTGKIQAWGGGGAGLGGAGAGGAVRLIANTISSAFTSVEVRGGTASSSGGMGRVRIEAYTLEGTIGAVPDFSYAAPGSVFPAVTPSLKISAINGVSAPSQPTGQFNTPDITLPTTTANPATVALQASNIPVGTVIAVRVTPQFGALSSANSTPLSGTTASSSATAKVTLPTSDPAVVTATATFTLASAQGFPKPVYAGEEVTRARVAAAYGGASRVTYLTASGKEVPADQVAWWPAGW